MIDQFKLMANCPEIQDGWEPKVGDRTDKGVIVKISRTDYSIKHEGAYHFYITPYSEDWHSHTVQSFFINRVVWLPTIEQLMGMIPDRCEFELGRDVLKKSTRKAFFVVIDDGFPIFAGASPQEVLVQAVMHELYNKKWNGERWIDENS